MVMKAMQIVLVGAVIFAAAGFATPARADSALSLRQVVETVNGSLDRVFGIKFPRARTPWGLLTRIAAKVAAHDLLICLNHLFDRPTFSLFDPFTS